MKSNNSLDKFRNLVETDLTALAGSWSLLPVCQQSMVVETLLLEYSPSTVSKWLGRRHVWQALRSVVNLLEVWSRHTLPDPDMVAALARKYMRLESRECNKDEQTVLSCLAGRGDRVRGASYLGHGWQVPLCGYGEMSDATNLLHFLSREGLVGIGEIISDKELRRVSVAAREIFCPGTPRVYSEEEFITMCGEVFMSGVRCSSVRRPFLDRERTAVARFKKEKGSLEVKRIRSNMTRAQVFVLDRYLGEVTDPVESIPRSMRSDVRSVARDIIRVLHGWSGRTQTASKFLPEWQKVFYRFNSTEETAEYLACSSKPGRKPIVQASRLLFSPLGDFPAYTNLLVSRGGFVPDTFTAPSSASPHRSLFRVRQERLPELSGVVSHRGQALCLRQRLCMRTAYAKNATVTEADLDASKPLLSPRDIALVSEVLIKGKRQSEVAEAMGITQGAVSHRLVKAIERIHLAKEILPLPGIEAYQEVCSALHPDDAEVAAFEASMLHSHVCCFGKQVDSAARAGVSQPTISVHFRREAELIAVKASSLSLSTEARRACAVVDLIYKVPYALQKTYSSRFQWNDSEVHRSLPSESRKSHKVSISRKG